MVWVWIIIAIIVIALIIGFLMRGRGSRGTTAGRQSPVGRHASGENRADAGSTGPGTRGMDSAGATATGTPSTSTTGASAADSARESVGADEAGPGAGEAGDGAAGVADAPDRDDSESSTDAAVHTTTNYGSAADPHPESASAIPTDGGVLETGPDAASSALPLVAQDRTGQGSSALPADGSNEFDDVHDAVDTAPSPSGESVGAGSDEQIAHENDDAMPRRSGAPAQSAAEAARHDDNELEATRVEHPAAGSVGHQGGDGDGHVWSDGHDPERAAGNLDGSADDGGSVAPDSTPTDSTATATSAGDDSAGDSTVGYAVDSPSADDSAAGADPMTDRFGDGAASTRPDGSAPEGYPIKGNADSMLFHTEDSPRYAATQPEVWFRDEAAATSAGFAHWDRDKRSAAPSGSQPSGSVTDAATSDAAESAGATSDAAAGGTSYTVGTSHTGPAVTGLTGTSATGHSAESAASDSSPTTGAAPSDAPSNAEPDPMQEQFGAGAASPREDGSAPSEQHRIKGNADSMLFHTEDSPHYEGTEAEVWFTDEDAAKAAGFKHWDHRKR